MRKTFLNEDDRKKAGKQMESAAVS
jgi:hypothetical protein